MRFGPTNATSIDLCIYDLISASTYRESTDILCCENESLFAGLHIKTYPASVDKHKWRKLHFAAQQARQNAADLIVVQNHLPTAAALARRTRVPVVLHRHNLTKAIATSGVTNTIRRSWRLKQYSCLAGLIFVSQFCCDTFKRDFPETKTAKTVIYNGLNFEEWKPCENREREIICVGRAAPEKGIKEAAKAVVDVLRSGIGWRGRFILNETARFPEYLREVMDIIAPLSAQISTEFNQPLSTVRERCQRAAIAIVPSKWEEPFGRTAMEAHAAGCAVISSGTGGLPEISSKYALYLQREFLSSDIVSNLLTLITNPKLRTQLASDGRLHCEGNFSLSRMAATLDAFYDRVAVCRRRSTQI
jgi:glycosyltransferase involved in cell wall biosynthesis